VFINTLRNIREIKCFINLRVKKNFISQFFIKDAQLFKDIFWLLQMQVVNNRIIALYKTQKLFNAIINNKEIHKSDRFKFYIVNIQNYKIIFKLF